MKKQILGLAVVLFMGSTVCMAQDNRGGRPDMSKRIEQMVTELGKLRLKTSRRLWKK